MKDLNEIKKRIIEAGHEAVDELINVAKEKIVTGGEDDISADRIKKNCGHMGIIKSMMLLL